jgi:V/A-type H+/Na+-transporting ATPase subunit D
MADFKYSKNELLQQTSKLEQLNKYLPSLKLKKVLLQTEVNKASEELRQYDKTYLTYLQKVEGFASVFTDWRASSLSESLEIKIKNLHYDNIAGIEVPYLVDIEFDDSLRLIYSDPAWTQSGIWHLRQLKVHFERLQTGINKKEILQRELRIISIRINLFEKVLIPEINVIINKIKVFLQDQELQMIGQAKVAKAKAVRKRSQV